MLDTIDRLPAFLKQIVFWSDLVEEVDVELSLFKLDLDERKNFFNPSALETIQDLRVLLQFFGFEPDLSLLNDRYDSNPEDIIDYLQKEAEDLVFKIKSKGSKNYFDYIFDRIQKEGDLYVNFFDSTDTGHLDIIGTGNFYRALNYYDTSYSHLDQKLLTHNFAVSPFTDIIPLQPFFEGFLSGNNLDQGLILDDSWTLDYSLYGMSVSPTKHISVEFQANEIFTEGMDEFLITETYLRYLKNSTNFGRKGTEYPHIGISIAAYTLDDENSFITPTTEVDTSITAAWTGTSKVDLTVLYNYFYIGAGTEYYFQKNISESQIFSNDNFDVVNLSFPTNKVNSEILGTGDGLNDSFLPTLPYFPIVKKSFKVVYEDINSIERTVMDDGFGNLYYPEYFTTEQVLSGQVDLTDYASGTINYLTGEINLTTVVVTIPAVDVTPKNGDDLLCNYYSDYGFNVDSLAIANNSGSDVVNCSFHYIPAIDKNFHASFLVIVDRR